MRSSTTPSKSKSASVSKNKLSTPRSTKNGVRRDSEGRFAATNSRLAVLKKFNWKRASPIIAVVALVGGWLVYSSFATTAKPPAYQYSIRTCGASDTACRDKSVEAATYRLQAVILGRQTSTLYRAGAQRLAGDRTTVNQLAQHMLSYPEARWGNLTNRQFVDKMAQAAFGSLATTQQKTNWTRDLDQKKITREQLIKNASTIMKTSETRVFNATLATSNKDFVDRAFRVALKRPSNYSTPANSSWLQGLNSGKMTRAQVAFGIAMSTEAIQKNRQDIDRYVASQPQPPITQTAKQQQAKRVADAKNLNNNAKNGADAAGRLVAESRTRRDEARRIAAGGSQEKAQVDRVVAIKNRINSDLAKVRNIKATNQTRHNSVKKLRDTSRELTRRATDIPSAAIQTEMNVAVVHLTRAANAEKDMQTMQSHLVTAESQTRQGYATHQANKRRLAEARNQANQSQPRQTSGSSSQPATANCSQAVTAITRSSSRDCIRKLQAHGGITQDGIWGPNTQRVYDALHRVRINTPENNTSNANPCRVNANSQACRDALARELSGGSFNPSAGSGLTKGVCVLPSPNKYGWSKYVKSYRTDVGVVSSTNNKGQAKKDVTRAFCVSRKGSSGASGYLIAP